MKWLLLILFTIINAENINELSSVNILFSNHTEVPIARLEIGDRRLEGIHAGIIAEKILIAVKPEVADMKITFRGGAVEIFHGVDFRKVHEVNFEREGNHFYIRTE